MLSSKTIFLFDLSNLANFFVFRLGYFHFSCAYRVNNGKKMNLLSLYHFFAGKASDKQKEAIKRWAESSPDNYETLCREKKIFDAGILLVDKRNCSKENAPLLYKLINYTVKIAAVVLLVVVSVTIYKYQELVKKKIRGITNHTCSCRSKNKHNFTRWYVCVP